MGTETDLQPMNFSDILPGADDDWDHGGGEADRGDNLEPATPVEEPDPQDPSAENPPVEDPPAEDPPTEDPPAENPPAEDPPAEDPPADQVDPAKLEREKDIMIPKARFDQSRRQLDAAKRRIAELEARMQSANPEQGQAPGTQQQADLNDQMVQLQTEINELILDGKSAEAAAKQLELNQKLIEYGRSVAQQEADQTVTKRTEQQAYDAAVDELEAKFEFFDATSDSFDAELVGKVQVFRDAYINQGYSPANAVLQAAEDVVKLHRPELLEPPTPQPPVPTPAPRTTPVERNVQAAAAQPPAMGGERTTRAAQETSVNVMELTEAEFDNLTETELRRLRGDFN